MLFNAELSTGQVLYIPTSNLIKTIKTAFDLDTNCSNVILHSYQAYSTDFEIKSAVLACPN